MWYHVDWQIGTDILDEFAVSTFRFGGSKLIQNVSNLPFNTVSHRRWLEYSLMLLWTTQILHSYMMQEGCLLSVCEWHIKMVYQVNWKQLLWEGCSTMYTDVSPAQLSHTVTNIKITDHITRILKMFLGTYAYTLFHPFPQCHKVHVLNTLNI
jgi:hypothetical protein